MARLDKSRPRVVRRMHVGRRHSCGGSPPSNQVPPVEAVSIPICIDGRHLGEVVVRPVTGEEDRAAVIEQLSSFVEWYKLGAEISLLGRCRLQIAAHAARVAAAGGRGVSVDEAERIADWFRGIVQTAIQRGGVRAARAIWFILAFDSQRDLCGTWKPRCPALEAIGCPTVLDEGIEPSEDGGQIAEWLAAFPDAAASYVHHAVAGASDEDVMELRELVQADDDTLDALYAPEPIALADHDPHEAMYEAMSTLTRRRIDNDQISGALESWAFGSQTAVQEHAWEPPVRLGVCAWLARVALR